MAFSYTYLTTSEVADYLRLKERKVYDLVKQGQIPCTKVTGKLLFPRQSIDLWLMNHVEGDQPLGKRVPRVLAGSQDPLLEWAVRESGSDLAMLCHGSGDGVSRLLADEAMLAGLHMIDFAEGGYNQPSMLGLGGLRDLVLIRWAKRQQGLLLIQGNPLRITALKDLTRSEVRVVCRQSEAGAERLLHYLLQRDGIDYQQMNPIAHPALGEDDLALTISQGEADVGLGVEAAAHRHGLDFIPLHIECFDLALRRRSYFEPPIQHLLAFALGERFHTKAKAMQGYDLGELGAIAYNA